MIAPAPWSGKEEGTGEESADPDADYRKAKEEITLPTMSRNRVQPIKMLQLHR